MNAPQTTSSPSVWRSIRAVAWSFLGIRKNSEFKEDLAKVSPFHVIGSALPAFSYWCSGWSHWSTGWSLASAPQHHLKLKST